MGISLGGLIPRKEIELQVLADRKIAIDGYNTLYHYLTAIRDKFTGEPLRDSNGRITSHLSGLFYKTARLLENGIMPVYVFDGRPPVFKARTTEHRREIREQNMVKWKDAVEKGDTENVKKYAQGALSLTKEMVEQAKNLLDAMGVPFVQAPSEGEAQCSFMCRSGAVWAASSQDMDSIAFGSPRLVRNLATTGKRKLPGREKYVDVGIEFVELDNVLGTLGITLDQFIVMGILIGTDYNPGGIQKIGPKRALALVKEKKTLEACLAGHEWVFEPTPQEIFEFFRNPPVCQCEPVFGKPDGERMRKIMIDDYGFSTERVSPTLDKLCKSCEAPRQKGLQCFLK